MKKSLFDTEIYQTESDKQDKSLDRVAGFLSDQQMESAKIRDLANRPKPGSFAQMAKNTVEETMALFTGESTLSIRAASQPVGKLFYYKGALLVKTPFGTIVGGQFYIETLQNRVLDLVTVEAEVEINQLKAQLQTVTSGGFFGLIALAFKRLFNGENNG